VSAAGLEINGDLARRLDGIGVQQRTCGTRACGQFGQRLDDTGFVVGHHHRNQPRIGFQHPLQGFGRDTTVAIGLDQIELPTGFLQRPCRFQHRRVFDGADCKVSRNLLTGMIELRARCPPELVRTGRIAGQTRQTPGHRREHLWLQRCSGVVIQIQSHRQIPAPLEDVGGAACSWRHGYADIFGGAARRSLPGITLVNQVTQGDIAEKAVDLFAQFGPELVRQAAFAVLTVTAPPAAGRVDTFINRRDYLGNSNPVCRAAERIATTGAPRTGHQPVLA
jgi:hypothetical protein